MKNAMGFLAPLKEAGSMGMAGGLVIALIVWELAKQTIGGLFGFLFRKLSFYNDDRSIDIDLGGILATAAAAVLAILVMSFLLKGESKSK